MDTNAPASPPASGVPDDAFRQPIDMGLRGSTQPDDDAASATTQPKQKDHLWKPGQSGNPAGRKKGARHKALATLDAIGHAAAEGVLQKMVQAALGGDVRAADLLLKRAWPEQKGRHVSIELPPIKTAADIAKSIGVLANAVADGDLTPGEAHTLAGVLEIQRRTIETADLEARLAAIEAGMKGSK
jgi:Family of unknown function (DUF5681)